MISRRAGNFFPPSTEHLQIFSCTDCADNFFLIPQISHNRGSICRRFFSDAPLRQTIYFINFSHVDNFFPIMIPPPPGKIMVNPLLTCCSADMIKSDLKSHKNFIITLV